MNPLDVVRRQLAELGARVAARDVDGTCDLYADDGVLAGTMANNVGAGEVRAYVAAVLGDAQPLSWEWDDDGLVADTDGTVIWFFAPGRIVFGARRPFRLTGVLRRSADGAWRFAQFHGSIPDGG